MFDFFRFYERINELQGRQVNDTTDHGQGNLTPDEVREREGLKSRLQSEFERVYRGPGSAPLIVAHDPALQTPADGPRFPQFESVAYEDFKLNQLDEFSVTLSKSAADSLTARIISVVDFNSLVPVAHGIALLKGWWQDGTAARPLDEIIANCHAEVSEAWEEYRAGRMATWYESSESTKPEGFWVEISDLVIRIADSVGAGLSYEDDDRQDPDIGSATSIAEFVCLLHREMVMDLRCVRLCELFAQRHNVDLYAIIRLKLAYNVTRPYRHGNKKA